MRKKVLIKFSNFKTQTNMSYFPIKQSLKNTKLQGIKHLIIFCKKIQHFSFNMFDNLP